MSAPPPPFHDARPPAAGPTIARQLFSLAAPVIGINVLNVSALVVDALMCGRLEDAEIALTGLGFAMQIVFLMMVAIIGLTVGTVALVARAHGAGNAERVNHLMYQSTLLTAALGVTMAVLGITFAPALIGLLGGTGAVLESGVAYLRPLLAGSPFYYLTILYAGVMRGVGNTRIPFLFALIANLINLTSNYFLIFGNAGFPALGVSGAAISTVISQLVNCVLLIRVVRRGAVASLALPLTPQPIDGKLVREIFRVGWPAALDMLLLNVSFLSIIGMLAYLDLIAVAAHSIGMRIQSLAFVPGLGVSQATGAMVGQALGAGDVERARAVTRASIGLCSAVMTTLALIILFCAHPLVAFFNIQPGSPLEAYSLEWIRMLGYVMFPAAVHIALVGTFQGAGATWTSLGISLVGTVLVQLPLSYALGIALGLGPFGVWLAFPLSFLVRLMLGVIIYRRGRWATVGVQVAKQRRAGAGDAARAAAAPATARSDEPG